MKFISVMGYTIGMSFNVQHSYIHLFSTHNSMHRSSSGSTKKKNMIFAINHTRTAIPKLCSITNTALLWSNRPTPSKAHY